MDNEIDDSNDNDVIISAMIINAMAVVIVIIIVVMCDVTYVTYPMEIWFDVILGAEKYGHSDGASHDK